MSQLSEYRLRIKNLLASDDIEKALILEGVSPVGARAIGVSRAVVAQRSIGQQFVKPPLDERKPRESDTEPASGEDQ